MKNPITTALNALKHGLKAGLLTIALVAGVGFVTLPETIMAQADFCSNLSSEFSGFLDCTTDSYSSFTEFQGGLNKPDVTGYDPSLTEAEDAKTFAKNIANFALGFLGLIAVLIIIYSGFLYVTSRGEEGPMESGKNGIKYALIGIVIIFSSYAVVNTILQAPNGGNTPNGSLRGSSQAQAEAKARLANFNSVAEQLKASAGTITKEYDKTQKLYTRLQQLTQYKPNQITSRAEFVAYLEYLKQTLQNIANEAGPTSNLGANINAVIIRAINPGIQEINRVVTSERNDAIRNTQLENGLFNFGDSIANGLSNWWGTNFGTNRAVRRNFECSLPPEERSVNFETSECEEPNIEQNRTNLGLNITGLYSKLINDAVIPALFTDYGNFIDVEANKLNRVKRSIESYGAGNSQIRSDLNPIINSFNTLDTNLAALKVQTSFTTYFSPNQSNIFEGNQVPTVGSNTVNIAPLTNFLKTVQDLYIQLKDLKFTSPVIIASFVSGNAPLVVDFDASQSFDPASRSLTNGDFSWDPDGDGTEGVTNTEDVSCFESGNAAEYYKRAAITCVYKNPGQYLPSLIANTSQTDNDPVGAAGAQIVIPGVAYQSISVSPPVAKIALSANVVESGAETSPKILRQYDENGNLLIDISEFSVTLDDAKKGIKFSAEGTDTEAPEAGGEAKRIVKYQWIFGDSGVIVTGSGSSAPQSEELGVESDTGTTVGENAVNITKKFNRRGVYNAQLIVTDTKGNIDRKVFNVRVTDLVARVSSLNNLRQGFPGTEFVFDGTRSKSDVTPNLEYKWSIVDETDSSATGDNFSQEAFSEDNSELRYRFKSPGKKTITLEVRGANGKTDSDTFVVNIESQAPTAVLDFSFPDATNRPNLVYLTAENSFDKDDRAASSPEETAVSDIARYSYRIFNAQKGTDYELVLQEGQTEATALNSESVQLAFKRKGTFKVELTVTDKHGKQNVTTKDITINSIVDISFGNDQVYAQVLSEVVGSTNLQAEVKFVIESRNADSIEINFGDNSPVVPLAFGAANSDGVKTIETTHIYTRAGSFIVTVRAIKGNDINVAKTRVIVGTKDNPIAIPRVIIGSSVVANPEDMPVITRGTRITFDGTGSIDTQGGNTRIRYEWDMGDGNFRTGATVANYVYNDLPPANPGYFEVKLKVTDTTNPNLSDTKTIKIKVEAAKPSLQTVLAKVQQGKTTTPLNVTVEAIGAIDRDGKIDKYRFYYFPISDPNRQLGVKEVSLSSTTLTITTFGEQNQEIEYGFCVDLTDNDGNEVKCSELFPNGNFTKLTVKNGRNDVPRASFVVDRTNVKVGDTVKFTSTSSDPDGQIVEYTYDFEADNSFTNDKVWTQAQAEHTYTKKSEEDGYKVRLRIMDDKGATAVSSPITIFVDGSLDDPVAAFTEVTQDKTVKFRDRSRADTENSGRIVKYEWDFNGGLDSDGDGNPKNDADSTEPNPTHTYDVAGLYQVVLKIEDNEGNEATVTRNVSVLSIDPSKNNPYQGAVAAAGVVVEDEDGNPIGEDRTAEGFAFRDLVRSTPTKNPDTGIIQVSGEKARVTFNFAHLPANIRKIMIDRNIYFDTNSGSVTSQIGDGVRNNDVDIEQLTINPPITIEYTKEEFERNNGIRVQIAVQDVNGKIYTDQADIQFAGSNLKASVAFDPTENVPALIYLSSLIVVLLASSYIVRRRDTKSKTKLKI
jgi:PKD repeat protein